ncbi:glycoside hydrolase family 5 protein [Aurantibacter sp.]|uniref:glycoside hydrolase family 5 protein n=1 Tax=Aurantibacter sp. TaxID=2807103 RepID=UPI003264181C
MKVIGRLFLLLFVLSSTISQGQNNITTHNKFEIFRGTNIAHWLSQSKGRGIERQEKFTEKHIAAIVEMGFDHIRLPIDEEQMWDENGNRHKDAFELMEKCIQWCATNNLRIIVDLHILRSHHFNEKEKPLWTNSKEQDKFFDLWRDLSKSLKKYPNNLVAYELMNEAVADDHEQWNNLIANAFSALRELEPKRTIVIGSNRWQSTETFDALKVPENDKNIILSFHFYSPFLLSHYGASWTDLKNYNGPVHYPGILVSQSEFESLPKNQKTVVKKYVDQNWNKKLILKKWIKPIQKAKKLGLPLYCGEFGIVADAISKDRLDWYKDMISLFEEKGIGYANWNYESDNFGLIDSTGKNEELIQIVTNKK